MSASGPSGPLVYLSISLNMCFGYSKEIETVHLSIHNYVLVAK